MSEQTEAQPINMVMMLVLGLVVGIIAGYGAIVFRVMISFAHNLMFAGKIDFFYDANVHIPESVWGYAAVLIPVVGAIIVTWLVQTFAPEAKGHGVPEVIDAIYFNNGKIRPLVAVIKSIASAITIGSGGSVGREGPIIQIGSAFGSTVGQWVKMPVRQRIILIAAGAGAGIAATFNAPIGGVAFAIELLLVSVNAVTLAVVALATVTAAYIGRYYLGLTPAFDIPALALPEKQMTHLTELILFVPFGILIGLLSIAFIKLLYRLEDIFETMFKNAYVRHITGMAIFGCMMVAMMHFSGHYYIEGVGYATIKDLLENVILNPWFLLLLLAMKLLATALTIGSGGSGGVFSPGIFLGAALGSACGQWAAMLLPDAGINPVLFAVAGMAGMVCGTTGAVLTAITLLFEMTRDYNAVLPIVLTVAIAYITRRAFCTESIYTLKLLRRGHLVHEGLQAAVNASQKAKDVMNTDYHVIEREVLEENPQLIQEDAFSDNPIVVTEKGKITGVIPFKGAKIDSRFVTVRPQQSLLSVLRKLYTYDYHVAIVTTAPPNSSVCEIVGMITAHEVTRFASRVAELMNESV